MKRAGLGVQLLVDGDGPQDDSGCRNADIGVVEFYSEFLRGLNEVCFPQAGASSVPIARISHVRTKPAARLLRPPVGYARAVRCWVASYAVNHDGNTVKLRPRLVGSEYGSRPKLLVPKVRDVRLAVSRCYEDPVLVDRHGRICPVQGRARKTSKSRRTTAASSLRGERWPLSSAVGDIERSLSRQPPPEGRDQRGHEHDQGECEDRPPHERKCRQCRADQDGDRHDEGDPRQDEDQPRAERASTCSGLRRTPTSSRWTCDSAARSG
jgi:hypothetical protein